MSDKPYEKEKDVLLHEVELNVDYLSVCDFDGGWNRFIKIGHLEGKERKELIEHYIDIGEFAGLVKFKSKDQLISIEIDEAVELLLGHKNGSYELLNDYGDVEEIIFLDDELKNTIKQGFIELKQDGKMWFERAMSSGGEVEVLKLRIKELEEYASDYKTSFEELSKYTAQQNNKLNAIEEALTSKGTQLQDRAINALDILRSDDNEQKVNT